MKTSARSKEIMQALKDEAEAKDEVLTLDEIKEGVKIVPVRNAAGEMVNINLDLVEKMAAQGMRLSEIAAFFGMTVQELNGRRRMSDQLNQAVAQGRSKGIAAVSGKLLKNAMDGNLIAQIFYLKTVGGWREADRIPLDEFQREKVVLYLPDNHRDDHDGD